MTPEDLAADARFADTGLPLGQAGGLGQNLFGSSPAAIAPTQRAGNPALDAAMARALKTSQNPLVRFGQTLAGQNPDAALAPIMQYQIQQQQHDQQVQEFLTNKRLAIGGMAMNFFEKLANAPPDTRAGISAFGKEFIGPLMQEVGWPMTPAMAAAFATTPGAATTYGALATSRLGAERAKTIEPMIAAMKDPKAVHDLIQSEFAAAREQAIPDAQRAIAEYSRTIYNDKALLGRMGLLDNTTGKILPIPSSAFISGLLGDNNPLNGKDPVMKAAIASVLTDPKFEGYLVQNRIQPGPIDLGAYKILVEGAAKVQTAQGAATLASTQAGTKKTQVETAMAPYKTIPGQGGALVKVPLDGQPAGTAMQGATPGQQSKVSGNVQVVAETPSPGLQDTTAKDIAEGEQQIGALGRIGSILKTGSVDQFIGPLLTGARWNEWATKNLPESLVGKVPNALSALDFAEGQFHNFRIRAITGAAVRETEEPRILVETPDRKRDKPEVYRAKFEQSLENMRVLNARLKELVGPDGRMKIGVNPEDVAARHPLPDPLASAQPKRTGQPTRTR